MKKAIADRWIKALRSGEYKQADGKLKDKDGNFCCLGVLCDISNKGRWKTVVDVELYECETFTPAETHLNSTVRDWAGMKSLSGRLDLNADHAVSLADLNDGSGLANNLLSEVNGRKLNFDEIADVIQMTWEEL